MTPRTWIALASLLIVLAVGVSGSRSNTKPVPLVIAHRGASGYRPEHTRAAYQLALDHGADFIELDLVASRDGALIVRHERDLSATTDIALRPEWASRRTFKTVEGQRVHGWFVEDFSLAEIRLLRAVERFPNRSHAFDGQWPILTLDDVLAFARHESLRRGRRIGLYIETKESAFFRSQGVPLEEPLIAVLERAGYAGRTAPVFLQSFDAESLHRLRQRTTTRLVQLLEAGPVPSARQLRAIAAYADGIGPHKSLVLAPPRDGQPARPTGLLEAAHAVGLVVHPWTFRNDQLPSGFGGRADREYAAFWRAAVDGVFSDFPDEAIRSRQRFHGRRSRQTNSRSSRA